MQHAKSTRWLRIFWSLNHSKSAGYMF